MGRRRFRNWVKGLATNFVQRCDAALSAQFRSQQATAAPPTSPPVLAVKPRAELAPTYEFQRRQTYSISTSQRLWNTAYDRLKDGKDTEELVTAYVRTLMKSLGADPEATFGADVAADLEDPLRRQLVMKKLVDDGRSKVEKASKVTKRVGSFAQAVLSFKPLVNLAMSIPQAAPAALPWAGVCVGLQMLSNPAVAGKSNLAGITHVLSRMEWYDAVTEHLLNEDGLEIKDGASPAVLWQLEAKVVTLYKALLLYQMKSICSYYRHQGYVFLRGLALRDDWDADLKIVTEAEATLQRDSDQYNRLEEKKTLGLLAESGKEIEGSLGDIHQTLQDFVALQKAIHGDDRVTACQKDLRVVDPQHDMERIERSKDILVDDAYKWIFQTEEYATFTNWDHGGTKSPPLRLLWINGHAGTGKTMLMIGIIRELSRQPAVLAPNLSFFFCQGTDTSLNTATAVLRSLIWLLIIQQPLLSTHLLPRYNESGAALFKDRNAFYALSEVFRNMLKSPDLSPVYFAIDALDECDQGLPDLMELISISLILSDKVKWIVSSRPEFKPKAPDGADFWVELDAQRLKDPVYAYISHKVSSLKNRKGYTDSVLAQVSDELHQRAENTFLWVALVFKQLDSANGWNAVDLIKDMPPGLPDLYGHMITRIGTRGKDVQHCKNVLSTAALAFRPLSLSELGVLSGLKPEIERQTIVEECGSFLTIKDEIVYLIHQSAKEYLTEDWLRATGIAQRHADIGRRCIEAMSSVLKRNNYNLDNGFKPKDMEPPQQDPLASIRYSCVFWTDHYCLRNGESPESQKALVDDGTLLWFMKEHFLHWLESLSLLGRLSKGADSIRRLLHMAQMSGASHRLAEFLEDADKFVRSHGFIIDSAPMQTYGSALAFSPTTSKVKNAQWKHRLPFIQNISGIRSDWDAHRQTLEGHRGAVRAVAFSPDGKTLASASRDNTVRLWGAATGTHWQTLEGHRGEVRAVVFSPDGNTLASASHDGTVRLWDMVTGTRRQTLEGHSAPVNAVAFSPDGKTLASASDDKTVRIWDMATGTHRQTLEGHGAGGWVTAVAFSPVGKMLASASRDMTVRLWDTAMGTHLQTLKGHGGWVRAVAFSPDGEMLASASQDNTVRLWDAATGAHRQTLEGHRRRVWEVAFSPDGKTLASASQDNTVRLWDAATRTCRQTFEGHGEDVWAVAFSPDSKILASASEDKTVRLWDVAMRTRRQTLEGHRRQVTAVAFSPDGKMLASASADMTARLWDVATGTQRHTLEGHRNAVMAVTFSPDGTALASASEDMTVRLWDVVMGTHRQTLEGHGDWITAVAFSPDGQTLASASRDMTIRLWDVDTSMYRQTLEGHRRGVTAVAFSPDGKTLASASRDMTLRLWDAATGTHWQTLEGHSAPVNTVAFSPDGKTLASASDDKTVRLWDVATGTHRQTFEGHRGDGGSVTGVAFSDGRFLNTNYGSLRLSSIFASVDRYPDKHKSDHDLHVDDEWITVDTEKCLWLPKDYRPTGVALDGNFLAMGHVSGGLTFLQVKFE